MLNLSTVPLLETAPESNSCTTYPANCQACGLFKVSRNYKLETVLDPRVTNGGRPSEELPLILFVGPNPGREEDAEGLALLHREQTPGGFLRSFLGVEDDKGLETRWAYTTAVRCYPGRNRETFGDASPTDQQLRHCSFFLGQEIHRLKPAVVVCLGVPAMQAVLGQGAPKKLTKLDRMPIWIPSQHHGGEPIAVLALPNPVSHVYGRTDLTEPYMRCLQIAENLAFKRETPPVDFPRYLVETVEDFQHVLGIMNHQSPVIIDIENHIFLDAEPGKEEADVYRAVTAYHEDSELICSGFGWYDHEGQMHVAVVFDELLYRYDLWERALDRKIIVPHNAKFEVQNLFVYQGGVKNQIPGFRPIDLLELAKLDDEGLPMIDCTLQMLYLLDIGKGNNSLKTQATVRFNAPDWEAGIKNDMAEEAQRLQAAREAIRKKIAELAKLRDVMEAVPARSPEDEQILRGAQKLIQDAEQDLAKMPSRPSFRNASRQKMFLYNATDIYWTGLLYQQVRRELEELFRVDPRIGIAWWAFRRNLYTLSKVERNGIPVHRQRLSVYKELLQKRQREIKVAMLGCPIVQEALLDSETIGPRDTFEEALEQLGGQKKKFVHALLEIEPLKDLCPKTALDNWSVRDDILDVFCGGDPEAPPQKRPSTYKPWEQKSELQKVWWCVRTLRRIEKLLGTFVAQLECYTCPDGRVRPDFIMAKSEKIWAKDGAGADAAGAGGTSTSRLAASRPNSQQWDGDPAFRSCLAAVQQLLEVLEEDIPFTLFRPNRAIRRKRWGGNILWECDYSQVEPVFLSVVAGVQAWIKLFNQKLDLYCYLANDLYNIGLPTEPYGDKDWAWIRNNLKRGVSKKLRDVMKVIVLATMYEVGIETLAVQANITPGEARHFLHHFSVLYPEIGAYKATTRRLVRAGGFITTNFGKRRWFHADHFMGEDLVADTDRQAINFRIQSEGSDMNCWQGYYVIKWSEETGVSLKPHNFVHDSEWGEVDLDHAHEELPEVKRIMENRETLPFTMPVEVRTGLKVGPDYGHMVEYDAVQGCCLVELPGPTPGSDSVLEPMTIQDYLTICSLAS